jgi:hypothetical protein
MQVEVVNDKLIFEPESFTEHYAITEYIRQNVPPILEVSDDILVKE